MAGRVRDLKNEEPGQVRPYSNEFGLKDSLKAATQKTLGERATKAEAKENMGLIEQGLTEFEARLQCYEEQFKQSKAEAIQSCEQFEAGSTFDELSNLRQDVVRKIERAGKAWMGKDKKREESIAARNALKIAAKKAEAELMAIYDKVVKVRSGIFEDLIYEPQRAERQQSMPLNNYNSIMYRIRLDEARRAKELLPSETWQLYEQNQKRFDQAEKRAEKIKDNWEKFFNGEFYQRIQALKERVKITAKLEE